MIFEKGSFRDQAGKVFYSNNKVYRIINKEGLNRLKYIGFGSKSYFPSSPRLYSVTLVLQALASFGKITWPFSKELATSTMILPCRSTTKCTLPISSLDNISDSSTISRSNFTGLDFRLPIALFICLIWQKRIIRIFTSVAKELWNSTPNAVHKVGRQPGPSLPRHDYSIYVCVCVYLYL